MGLALEFKQPLLLAEGLAQGAVHHDWWYIEFLGTAEKLAHKAEEPALPLAELIDMMRADPKLSTASSLEYHTQTRKHSGIWAMDKEMARDGVLANAREEYLRLAARWRVDPDDVERATAELLNTAGMLADEILFACGANQTDSFPQSTPPPVLSAPLTSAPSTSGSCTV